MKLKTFWLLCASLLVFSIVAVASGQTNPIAVSPFLTNSVPESTASDIAKVFHDFGVNISADDIAKALIGLFFLARIARKYWIKDDGSTLSKIASHISLEAPSASPVNPPTISATATPSVPPKP